MALVPEDGTGLAGASTLATRAELIAWASLRGVTLPDTDPTDVHLILAMDYIWTLDLKGTQVEEDQGTPYPRLVPVCDEAPINTGVPASMKKVQLMLAFASSQGITLMNTQSAGRQVKSRDVGPMKRTYGDERLDFALIPGLSALLGPFLNSTQTGFEIVTRRV